VLEETLNPAQSINRHGHASTDRPHTAARAVVGT